MTIEQTILTQTGCKDFAQLKQKLLKAKKYNYGCYYSEINCKGFDAFYTSNDNHFCSFAVRFQGIGMCNTLAFDKASITPAGEKRGAGRHYLTASILQTKIKQYATV